ncbi:AMDHD2 [Cordylochernes scorpioides]|uniref:N-acetylglucosamine-6-phosphate deacetylase n=1 Tax=Cordylochernes scorpioides TaxID=51811 RepID=A0ABY6KI65_9ARAC|nr:AMDHD2 [Cordylochernes scorpioides]
MPSASEIIRFRNCSILRGHRIYKEDLWVRNKKIIDPEPLFYNEKAMADIEVDCHGLLLAPGYIDVQINGRVIGDRFYVNTCWVAMGGALAGAVGVDFSEDMANLREGVDKVAKHLLSTGTTSFCPTMVTSDPDKYKQIVPAIKPRNGGSHGAGILGLHLEGPFIAPEKKGAHQQHLIRNLDRGIQDLEETYGALDNVALVTLAPELDPEGTVTKSLVQRGIRVSMGHSVGTLSDGKQAVHNGATFITHLFNAMLPFHHRDPGLVGLLTTDFPKDCQLFFGMICDNIHTHPAALRIAQRSHPSGLVLVTDAMSAMGMPQGIHHLSQLQVEIRGQAAYLASTNTLAGSIATMDACVRNFYAASGCTLVEALEAATLHPAQLMGITNIKGTLDYGTDADLVLLDSDLNVVRTYIDGECVWSK